MPPGDQIPERVRVTRRRKIALLALAAVVLSGAVVLRWLLDPAWLVPRILSLAGDVLGMRITAEGAGEYRMRGTARQRVVSGKSGSVRVDLGGRLPIKKKK